MKAEELVIKNRDGKRMPATLQHPEGASRGTAVVFHGLAGWRNHPLLANVADVLVRNGYATLRFDCADGIVSPDGDFFRSTTTGYVRDVEDALAYVHQSSWHHGQLVLVGHSLGGLVAAWYAAQHPTEVARLILIAPAISWRSMWWKWLPLSLLWFIRGYRKMLGIDGKRFALAPTWWMDFFKYDTGTYAPQVPAPTLVISAEVDRTVARPTAERALARRFPNGEHTMVSWSNHIFDKHEDEVVDTIEQWLTSS